MKKFISAFLMCLCLFGCGCKNVKVKIDYVGMPTASESSTYLYENYGLLSHELKDTSEYDIKIENKDNFLLFVYSEECYGCSLLAPALKEYVNENSLAIYTISSQKINNHSLYKEYGIRDTPYLVLIDEGELVYKELVLLENKPEENIKWVEKWMENHIEWSVKNEENN